MRTFRFSSLHYISQQNCDAFVIGLWIQVWWAICEFLEVFFSLYSPSSSLCCSFLRFDSFRCDVVVWKDPFSHILSQTLAFLVTFRIAFVFFHLGREWGVGYTEFKCSFQKNSIWTQRIHITSASKVNQWVNWSLLIFVLSDLLVRNEDSLIQIQNDWSAIEDQFRVKTKGNLVPNTLFFFFFFFSTLLSQKQIDEKEF